MIIVKPVGGLASQLHKYAIGRALSEKHGVDLKLDLSWFRDTPETDTPWPFVIDNFNIKAREASIAEIKKLKPYKFGIKFNRLLKRLFNIDFPFKNYSNQSFLSLDAFFSLPRNIYIEGEFAGFKYIESIRNILQEEIKPKENSSTIFKKHLSFLKSNDLVVSIHFRRGDFISNESASSFHHLCSNDYYQKSVLYLKESVGSFSLLIFSDDLEWVKDNIYFEGLRSVKYVEGLKDFEEFQLMSMCSHNIISNSGFSWFSAWLNSNDNIIVSPTKWVFDKTVNSNLLRDLDSGNMVFIKND